LGRFSGTGICPYYSSAIPDEALASSLLTRKELGENEAPVNLKFLTYESNIRTFAPKIKK
jgi:hypothetical protein